MALSPVLRLPTAAAAPWGPLDGTETWLSTLELEQLAQKNLRPAP